MYFIVKTLVTALLIAAISELAKRISFLGALLASLPITSMLAFTWIYFDTNDTKQVAKLSLEIFWLVIPSLLFFIVLPMLLESNVKFLPSMVLSSIVTATFYFLWIVIIRKFGVTI